MELNEILNRSADRIVADGTRAESRTLQAMAAAARGLTPGAADALIDWTGSEIARLRAFSVVHGVLLRDLPAHAQTELLNRLLGASPSQAVPRPVLPEVAIIGA